jgi:cell shape-determining protein MreC
MSQLTDNWAEIERLERENAKLRAALEFYARRKHELEVVETDDCSDTGAYGLRAREVLGYIV